MHNKYAHVQVASRTHVRFVVAVVSLGGLPPWVVPQVWGWPELELHGNGVHTVVLSREISVYMALLNACMHVTVYVRQSQAGRCLCTWHYTKLVCNHIQF
jgi:hypothetical protein